MELKLIIHKYTDSYLHKLLIVPYGIETDVDRVGSKGRNLLIVPYGIET